MAGRSERTLVYLAAAGDSWAGIAGRFLGDTSRAWQVATANLPAPQPRAGDALVVPLVPPNPLGILPDGVQTVPILCYHRLGSGSSKMIVGPDRFEAQLAYLARNGYHVARLAEVREFLAGTRALPPRTVVLTFDDGYESVYRHAFPLLRKYNFPATVFVYTDFIGARDALTWAQLEEMARSGLVDVQAHSKSHRDLSERAAGESDDAYRRNVEREVAEPRAMLERRLGAAGVRVRHFAFPYGTSNDVVLDALADQHYDLGLTVVAGGNPAFASPWMLRRTMIYGDHDLDDFKARLQVRRTWRP